jgi:hypothetical protein
MMMGGFFFLLQLFASSRIDRFGGTIDPGPFLLFDDDDDDDDVC